MAKRQTYVLVHFTILSKSWKKIFFYFSKNTLIIIMVRENIPLDQQTLYQAHVNIHAKAFYG